MKYDGDFVLGSINKFILYLKYSFNDKSVMRVLFFYSFQWLNANFAPLKEYVNAITKKRYIYIKPGHIPHMFTVLNSHQ